MVTGWSVAYIEDEFRWSDFIKLAKHWEGCPPVHRMIAGYFKIKPKQIGKLEDLVEHFGAGSVIKNG